MYNVYQGVYGLYLTPAQVIPIYTVKAQDVHAPVTVLVHDTVTGEMSFVKDISIWSWTEGNWSCDCNRHMYFDNDHEPEQCECKRYLVVWYDEKQAPGFTLNEFNGGYETGA